MENSKNETELIQAIIKHKWMRWSHIDWQSLSFSRPTAYNHGLNKLDTIKGTFEQNRSKGVNYLLQKWMQSDNPTLQIAAFKIIADEDDHRRLNQSYVEQKNTEIDLSDLTTDEIKQMLKSE